MEKYLISTVIAYPMNKADLTYRSFLPFTRHPLNLSSYMHLYAHIGAYVFFLIFPTFGFGKRSFDLVWLGHVKL